MDEKEVMALEDEMDAVVDEKVEAAVEQIWEEEEAEEVEEVGKVVSIKVMEIVEEASGGKVTARNYPYLQQAAHLVLYWRVGYSKEHLKNPAYGRH